MPAFILRRLAQAALVMAAVGFIAFVLFRYVGDPVSSLLGQNATPERVQALRAELGLDRSVPEQFVRFAAQALQGEFGLSLRQGQKVSTLILERLPATLELALLAAVLALGLGVPLGVWAALHRTRPAVRVLMGLSLLGVSLPTFLIGIFLILFFAVQLGWLPSFGRGETVALGGWQTGLLTADGWKHLLLPALTLAVYQVALILRLVRAEMLEVLRSDYVKFARARGLPERRVHFGHALRNALVPVLTISALQLGNLIAFAVVTETVFQWPGLGSLFIQSVQFADVPVMAAYLCGVSLVFVSLNLAVDLAYAWIDPRLRHAGTGVAR